MEDVLEQQKASAASISTFAWIGVGMLMFALDDKAHVLSWQGAAYFLLGVVLASIVFGTVTYLTRRRIIGIIISVFPNQIGIATILASLTGMLLPLLQISAIYLTASWLFSRILFPV